MVRKYSQTAYGLSQALPKIFPPPIVATRAPTTADLADIGTIWVNKSTDDVYALSSIAAGLGTWALLGGASSDVNTLTGDTGTAVPSAGNINVLGGTNITTVGASPTGDDLTVNLDAAITLATSVTSPLYTAPGGSDLEITAAAGQDIVFTLGDAAGANNITFNSVTPGLLGTLDSSGDLTLVSFITNNAVASVNINAANIDVSGAGADVDLTVTPKGAGNLTVDNGDIRAQSANISGNVRVYAFNTDNTMTDSIATVSSISGGTSGGDAIFTAAVNAGNSWSWGLDNSTTNDDFVLVSGAALGTNNIISVDGSSFTMSLPTGDFAVSRSSAAANVDVTFANSDNTNAASDVRVYASVGGTSGGDPMFISLISGGQGYALGAANQVAGDPFTISSGQNLDTPLVTVSSAGVLSLPVAGSYIAIEGGAVTDFIGTFSLSGGSANIANTNIAAGDIIILSRITLGTGAGHLSYAINAGSDFTVTSSSGTDDGSIGYLIVRPL